MKRLPVVLFVGLCLLAGCGGSAKPAISVSVSPTSATLDAGSGAASSTTLAATVANDSSNSGVKWTLSGPGSLASQTATGVVYDAPASAASSETATVTATSAATGATASASVAITINPAPQVTTASLTAAPDYNAYTATLTASGGTSPLTWVVSSGSLPSWATLNVSTGAISGTPGSASAATTTNFSIVVTDKLGDTSAPQALSLTINPPPKLTITTSSLPTATEGQPYNATVTATGGFGAYDWLQGPSLLPPGLTINASTGQITGTVGIAFGTGTFPAAIDVEDQENPPVTAVAGLNIVINGPLPLTISTQSLPPGTSGTPYSAQLSAAGGIAPYTWNLSAPLPSGLSLDPSTGVISGMPNSDTASTAGFTVTVADSNSPATTTSASFNIVIAAPPALKITTSSLPPGNAGTPYTATLAAQGGVAPYTSWAIASGSLPSWATLDASTGVISGSNPTTGTSTFTVSVTDSEEAPVTATSTSLTLNINPASTANDSELKGQYGFLLQGFDDASGHQFAIVGSFIADGSGNISGGMFDVNGPSPATAVSVSTGSYSIGADNRGTLTLHGSDASSRTFAIALGAISSGVASQASMIEFDDTSGTTGNRGSGNIYLQDTTKFNLSSINGPYAFLFTGENGTAGTLLTNIGAFTANGSGNITGGEMDSNDTGTLSNGTFTATLSTDANTSTYGRLTLALGGGPTGSATVYVVSASRLLAMTTGTETTTGLESGEMRSQSTTSFSTSSLNGNAIFDSVGLGSTSGDSNSEIGLLQFNGSGSVTIDIDQNDSGNYRSNTGTFGYTVASNGRVTLTGGSGHVPIFYLISNNKAFAMATDSSAFAGSFTPQSSGPFTVGSVSGDYYFGSAAPTVTGVPLSTGIATSTGNGSVISVGDVSGPGGVLLSAQSITLTVTAGSNGRFTDNQNNIYWMISPSRFVVINTVTTTSTVTTVGQ